MKIIFLFIVSISFGNINGQSSDLYIINHDETWTTESIPYANFHEIRVENGAVLTIEPDVAVHFHSDGLMRICCEAKVILKGRLTSLDPSSSWGGVQNNGEGIDLPVSSYPETVLRCEKGSIIENARIAVSIPGWDIASFGFVARGTIEASGTKFINNAQAISIGKNGGHEIPQPNHCIFRHCTFLTKKDYNVCHPNDEPFTEFVKLQDTENISFSDCDFINLYNPDPPIGDCFGIRSDRSSFTVTGIYDSKYQITHRSHFQGLTIGIKINREFINIGGSIPTKPNITETIFEMCDIGIKVDNSSFVTIALNTFILGRVRYPSILDNQIGVDFHGNDPFSVFEENEFVRKKSIGNIENTTGSNCWDIGYSNLYVRRNTYKNIRYANLSSGENANSNQTQGLVYLCNQNQNNVTQSTDFYVSRGKIRQTQGILVGITTITSIPAGNTFSHTGYYAGDFNNQGQSLNYYYYLPSPEEFPLERYGIAVLPETDHENTCEQQYFHLGKPIRIDEDPSHQPTDVFFEKRSMWLNAREDYYSVLDGGNRQELIMLINSISSDEIEELKSHLLSLSPYLSSDVIKLIIEKQLFSNDELTQIILANPGIRFNQNFYDSLHSFYEPFSENQINQIKENEARTSARTALLSKIAYYRQEMDKSARVCIKQELNDSTFISLDSMINWNRELYIRSLDYKRVEALVYAGEYDQALQMMDETIPNKYYFSIDDLEEYQEFRDLVVIYIHDIYENGFSIDSIPEEYLQKIFDFHENARGYAKYSAESFYSAATRYIFLNYQLPEERMQERNYRDLGTYEEKEKRVITVAPNPSTNSVKFEYLNPENATLRIIITDLAGRRIIDIFDSTQTFIWDTKNTTAGMYLYTIYRNNNILKTGKLIIQK